MKPDKRELDALERQITALNNRTIRIRVDTTGTDVKAIRALARLETAQAKIKKSENDLAIAREKTKQITEQRIATEFRLAAQQEKTATANAKAAVSLKQVEAAAGKTGDTIGKLVGKVALWGIATTLIYSPLRGFKEALQILQSVDDQLVNVRKVTDLSAEQLAKLEKQAYKTASAYGELANEYLKSATEFARAGYQKQIEALAQLSTKTQIVGDLTAETANQFLLSVDAAYKYNGSVEELSKVLDGANKIDNEYATSIEKIAEGLGIVAPVAAQARVSIGELTAAIGTITAVTQRSGAEAARAFRALVLNILGDTKTEIDEGVTWTTGEIAGLRDIIKEYASEAYRAAEATGQVINPMEAIAGLAKSMEEGLLTEQKLMEMVSDIGGKLRASQLLALIQHWDMYKSMLVDFENAVGSADKEVANAMDSWTRKTNVLKNTWAEFISNLVDTEWIKTGIDAVTGFINLLDSEFGRGVIQVTALSSALFLVAKAFAAIKTSAVVAGLTSYISAVTAAAAGSKAAASALVFMNNAILSSPLFFAAVGSLAIWGIIKAVDALTVSLEEQREIVSNLRDEIASLSSEYETLAAKTERTALEEKRLALLKAQLDVQREILRIEGRKQERMEWTEDQVVTNILGQSVMPTTLKGTRSLAYKDIEDYRKAAIAIAQLNTAQGENLEILEKLQEAALNERNSILNNIQSLEELKETTGGLLPENQKLLDDLYAAAYAFGFISKAADDAGESQNQLAGDSETLSDAIQKASVELEKAKNGYDAISDAVKDYSKQLFLSADTLAALERVIPGVTELLYEENGQLKETAIAALSSTDSLIKFIAAQKAVQYEAERADYKNQIRELNRLKTAAEQAGNWMLALAITQDIGRAGAAMSKARDLYGEFADLIRKISDVSNAPGNRGKGKGPWEKARDELDDYLKEQERAIELMKRQGATTEEIVAKYREMQQRVAALASEYRRATGVAEDDFTRQLSLLWHEYADDIKDVYRELREAAIESAEDIIDAFSDKIDEQVDLLDESLKRLREDYEAQINALDAELEALEKQNKARKDANALADKLLAIQQRELEVEKAREALENAKNERTLRVWNAATGQWERVADYRTVRTATEKLADAQQALADAQKDLAEFYEDKLFDAAKEEIETRKRAAKETYEAAKKQIENQKNSLEGAFGAFKKIFESLTDALEDGTITLTEFIMRLVIKTNEISDKYGVDMSAALNEIIAAMAPGPLKDAFSVLIKEYNLLRQSLENGSITLTEFIFTLARRTNEISEKYGVDLSGALNEIIAAMAPGPLRNAFTEFINEYNSLRQELKNGTLSFIDFVTDLIGKTTEVSAKYGVDMSAAFQLVIDAIADAARKLGNVVQVTPSGNAPPGTQIGDIVRTGDGEYLVVPPGTPGANYNPESGLWSIKLGSGTGTGSGSSSGGGSGSSSGTGGGGGKVVQVTPSGNAPPGTQVGDVVVTGGGNFLVVPPGTPGASYNPSSGLWSVRVYDAGGILHGTGGIKATPEDEAILPPDITKAMLTPTSDAVFRERVAQLGYLFGSSNIYPGLERAISTQTSNINNSRNYNINGVPIPVNYAKTMTIEQLASALSVLPIYPAS